MCIRDSLRAGITIGTGHRGGKAVSLPHHGFYETRLLRVVPQHQTDLADSSVNTVIDVKEYVLAPKALGDFVPRHQYPTPFGQQDEQFHGEIFQAQKAVAPLEPITRLVECEIPEMEFLGHESPSRRADVDLSLIHI